MMNFQYDAKQDALLVTFRENVDYEYSQEVYPGFVIDYDSTGRPIGFDIYHDASKLIDIAALQKNAAVEAAEHQTPRFQAEEPFSATMMIADRPEPKNVPKKKR